MMKNSCSILLIQRIHFKNHYFKSECCHKYNAATQRGGCSVYSLPTNIFAATQRGNGKIIFAYYNIYHPNSRRQIINS